MRQVSPLTSRARHIYDGVDDLTPIHAGVPSFVAFYIRPNLSPLLVRQIGVVSLSHLSSV